MSTLSEPELLAPEALAAVSDPEAGTRVVSLPRVGADDDDGWLRVDGSGICGTDVSLAMGGLSAPAVLGHHVVGRIAEIGVSAARRWKVHPGDQVAVEEYLPCGACASCLDGMYRLCAETDLWGRGRRVGMVPVAERPYLWGGNAQYMYLPPNAAVHRLPDDLPTHLAVWTQPLGNAVDWLGRVGGLTAGETVVVLGPGYHGLAAVAAARELGARRVLVVGSGRDAPRLALARELGAETIDATGNPAEHVRELTDGQLADLVLDVAGADPSSVGKALRMLGQQGRLVVAGIKQPAEVPLDTADLVRSMHTVVGVRGRNPASISSSIGMLARGGAGLTVIPTHETDLHGVGAMLTHLHAGDGPATPHVVVRPWSTPSDHDHGKRPTHIEKGHHEQASTVL